jgi:hypothetical protein
VLEARDQGCVPLHSVDDAKALVAACRKLRFWPREAMVKQI